MNQMSGLLEAFDAALCCGSGDRDLPVHPPGHASPSATHRIRNRNCQSGQESEFEDRPKSTLEPVAEATRDDKELKEFEALEEKRLESSVKLSTNKRLLVYPSRLIRCCACSLARAFCFADATASSQKAFRRE